MEANDRMMPALAVDGAVRDTKAYVRSCATTPGSSWSWWWLACSPRTGTGVRQILHGRYCSRRGVAVLLKLTIAAEHRIAHYWKSRGPGGCEHLHALLLRVAGAVRIEVRHLEALVQLFGLDVHFEGVFTASSPDHRGGGHAARRRGVLRIYRRTE
jgi:hypothetical protein